MMIPLQQKHQQQGVLPVVVPILKRQRSLSMYNKNASSSSFSRRISLSLMVMMMMTTTLVVLTMKSSCAFIIPFSVLPRQRHQPHHPQWNMVPTTTTTTSSSSSSVKQQQQQQQAVDDDYFTALQNFAATATTTAETASMVVTDESSNQQIQDDDHKRQMSWRDDGFIYGLDNGSNHSVLQRPVGKQALIVVEGDSMETKPYQIILVTMTFINHLFYLCTSSIELYHTTSSSSAGVALDTSIAVASAAVVVTQLMVASIVSWMMADFGSGVLHWSVDNYGNGRTPIMGSIIAAFQGHHTAPWTITQRSFYNNVYKLCLPFGIVPVTLFAYLTGPLTTYFLTLFCILEILSQEFHKWSHQTKSETPSIGNVLQHYQLAIGRVPHTKHHTIPFETNYCIISGICNPILDQIGFFRRLEHIIYNINGIESNAWKLDPILRKRTLDGIYTPPPDARYR